MKIYFDSCSFQRPLDDQTQLRIRLESEAVLGILKLWEVQEIELIGSEVLHFEASKIPNPERKAYILEILYRLAPTIELNEEIENRANFFTQSGVKPIDALHLACAEFSEADYFCTCDDRFLKNAQKIDPINIEIVSPLVLIEKMKL